MAKRTVDFFFKDSASQTLACVASVSSRVIAQGREEMCLSLEHQNSEKMGYFDRVTVSLHILETADQETEGSQDRLRASVALRATAFGFPSGDVPCASEDMACGY